MRGRVEQLEVAGLRAAIAERLAQVGLALVGRIAVEQLQHITQGPDAETRDVGHGGQVEQEVRRPRGDGLAGLVQQRPGRIRGDFALDHKHRHGHAALYLRHTDLHGAHSVFTLST
jgi:hypothetical protein